MKTKLEKLLTVLSTCEDANEWASGKTLGEGWFTCKRGDWMLYLAQQVGVDFRTITHIKGLSASLVSGLMVEEASRLAVVNSISYGLGEIELTDDHYSEAFRASQKVRATGTLAQAYAARAASYACIPDVKSKTGHHSHHAVNYAYYAIYYTALADDMCLNSQRTFEKTLELCAKICRGIIPFSIIAEKVDEKLMS